MKKYCQTRKFSEINSDQSGQALVEFVLIMVITAGLLMAAKKAFSGLDKFINHYIADYTVCLMEYGELPSLGVRDGDQKKHESSSQCDKDFEAFTWASGRPPVSAGSGSGTSRTATASKEKTRGSGEQGDSSGAPSSGSKRNLTRSRTSQYANGQVSRAGSLGSVDGGAVAVKKTRVIDIEDDPELEGSERTSTNIVGLRKTKYRAIKGKLAAEILKKERRPVRIPTSIAIPVKEAAEGPRIGPYKKVINPPTPKADIVENKEEEGFQFGNIFRMLIIIAMILAIVIFFGGQIMNYNNSKD